MARALILILACVPLVALVVAGSEHWEAFKVKHGKTYKSPLEEAMRKSIFLANKERIDRFNKHQSPEAGYKQGLSHLSDLTFDEVKIRNGLRVSSSGKPKNSPEAELFFKNLMANVKDSEVPDSMDWRQHKGRVTEIKDQAQCGSCWAFSSTGALEGQMTVRNVTLKPLSEQNLVDCSKNNNGCFGGVMLNAFSDIGAEGGIEDEEDYPYIAKDRKCKFDKSKVVFNDKSGYNLDQGDEQLLKKTVATYGPVSVGIDASLDSFMNYKSGVYYDKDCSSAWNAVDHAVLVVGYGTDKDGGDYWLVKNSWGLSWGEDGYIKMARNRNNHCSIASWAMIPTF